MKNALIVCVILFQGYSYVAPSVLFTNNVISKEIFCDPQLTDKKPSLANLIYCKFKVSYSEPHLEDIIALSSEHPGSPTFMHFFVHWNLKFSISVFVSQ